MSTVGELLARAGELPGDSPRRDVEILLGHCLDKSRTWLFTWPEAEVGAAAQARFNGLFARRQRGEPLAYLTGSREFWSLQLKVNESTLIPRPDTETLVEWALELALPADAAALDLGTGTGAIALALASERPAWQLVGVDASAAAVALARENARRLDCPQVRFVQSDWFAGLAGSRYHLLVSNPPYIEAGDPHLAQGDVRFEPRAALVSGPDGLDDIRRIIAAAPAHLHRGGWLLLEHGFDQGPSVRRLLGATNFKQVSTRRDLGGRERISGGCIGAD